MIDTGFGYDECLAAETPRIAAAFHKSDSSQCQTTSVSKRDCKAGRLPTVKDAWRWIRSVVEDLTSFEQEKRLLKDFIKNLNTELQSLEIP